MPRYPQHLTVRSQILALMLVVVLPAAAGVAWALSAVLASEKDAATAQVRATSTQVANNLGLLLREREALLDRLAGLVRRPDAGPDPCTALAAEWPRLSPDGSGLSVFGLDGQRRCGAGSNPLAATPVRDAPWFARALDAASPQAGPVLPGIAPGSWTAPLGVALRDAAGRQVGVLVLPLDLLALQQLVMPPAAAPALVSVIDGDDALLMRSVDPSKWQGRPPPTGLAAQARGLRDAVLVGEGLDGQRRLFAFSGVPGTSWRVVAGLPEDEVLAHYHRLLRISAGAGALLLALLLVLAWRLADRIVRPIRGLAATSARVAQGDVTVRAAVTGPAEVAAVALQLNQMLDAGRASQQALAASEAQLRFLIDHLFAGVVVHAPDSSVLLANARACELLGLTQQQMAGKAAIDPQWRFLREDGTPMPVDEYPVTRVIRRGQALIDFVGAIARSAAAEPVWVIVNAYPQFHDDGRLRQVVVSFVDITARKKAEQTLAASESRYRMLFENSLDGVLQTRPDGSVLAANPAACAIFGLDEAALRERGRDGLADPGDPRLAALLAQRARQGHAQGRATLLRGDGSRFEAELASSLYTGADGEPLASLLVRDVSRQLSEEQARARLEAQLRESQKMEAIGTLAGGIAHDFNNILGGLLGNAALAADTLATDHPARPHLLQVTRAGQRARALVQQILAFSRRPSQPIQHERLALRPLVDETVALLRATLPAGVRLVLTASDEPIEIDGDATQIQQVLMNLCTNAWHAMAGGSGLIRLRLARRDFGAADADRPAGLPAGAYALLQVSDDGCGMDDATRARIFEPFFTTKPVGQGTGLGLAVVHGIVAAHRGEIVVHSGPGEGSRFAVYLPLAANDVDAPGAASARSPTGEAGRGQHVLYVDDDEVMLLMVVQLLERAGYRVTGLSGVGQALAALRQPAPAFDLVVTDFNMPDGSGLDVAREALQRQPGRPVVLSSGFLPETLRAEAIGLGVRALLMKEHTVDELPALVARLLAPAP